MKHKLFLSALALLISGTLLAQSAPADKKTCNIVASIDNHTGTSTITKAELDNLKEVTVKNDCDKDAYTIVSFEFTTMVDGKAIGLIGTSAVLTPEMKAALAKTKAGSKVFLDSFTAKTATGPVKKIPGITLKVK